ncbi:hypothetical protein [Alienimonas chondri]|uniref:Uncharacterized protein n=1 Tax=Alienimonas chondri TaxID=2681879 RepID=A0ABX1VHR3_9PLAN|nr:hypothetical protein [Alienimonas chondri]NNJ27625.1 hypothetical protein [Alienimonas chondri]
MSGPSTAGAAAIIVCEGYHDRAFWSGLLINHAGFVAPPKGERVKDPAGMPVTGGQFGFRSVAGERYAEIVPARGVSKLLETFDIQLKRSKRLAVRHLIYNYDSDSPTSGARERLATLRDRVVNAAKGATQQVTDYDEDRLQFEVSRTGGANTLVAVCPWACDTPEGLEEGVRNGIPEKQTLERLVCAAYASAEPDRVTRTAVWLAENPARAEPRSAKSEAFSLMAKWHPVDGVERFYESLWEDERTRGPLLKLLASSEAWPAIRLLAVPSG